MQLRILKNQNGFLGSVGFALIAPVLILVIGILYDTGEQLVGRAQIQVAIDASLIGVGTLHRIQPIWGEGIGSKTELLLESQFKYNLKLNAVSETLNSYTCAEEANSDAQTRAFYVGPHPDNPSVTQYRITCNLPRKNRFGHLLNLVRF